MDDVERSELMERLVQADDVAALLAVVSLDNIAEAWWRHHDARHPGRDWGRDEWVTAFLSMASLSDELERAAIVKIIEAAPDDGSARLVAATLEDVLSDTPETVQWFEEQAMRSERFRIALSGTHASMIVNESSLARLERAAGVSLPQPPHDRVTDVP